MAKPKLEVWISGGELLQNFELTAQDVEQDVWLTPQDEELTFLLDME